jgi:hypothetical protein
LARIEAEVWELSCRFARHVTFVAITPLDPRPFADFIAGYTEAVQPLLPALRLQWPGGCCWGLNRQSPSAADAVLWLAEKVAACCGSAEEWLVDLPDKAERTALGELAARELQDLERLAVDPPARLAFDDDTLTVTLDGTPHRVLEPRAYAVYKAIVRRQGPTITKAEIRAKIKGLSGQKTIPGLIKILPEPLRKTVSNCNKGYHTVLPGKKKSREQDQ